MKYLILILALTTQVTLAFTPANAPTPQEKALIAAVLVAEAGGELKVGLSAVYEVIWKRVSNTNSSYTQVVTKPKQFSCLNSMSKKKLIRKMRKQPRYKWVHDDLLKFPPLTTLTVPKGMEKLNTNRSDHYFAHNKVKPSWSNGKGTIIGNHTFELHRK